MNHERPRIREAVAMECCAEGRIESCINANAEMSADKKADRIGGGAGLVNAPPTPPNSSPPSFGDLRGANLETEALNKALADALANLPASLSSETLLALANVAEEKARRARQLVDEMIRKL